MSLLIICFWVLWIGVMVFGWCIYSLGWGGGGSSIFDDVTCAESCEDSESRYDKISFTFKFIMVNISILQ